MSRRTKCLSTTTKIRREVLTVLCKNKFAALYPQSEEKQRDRFFQYVKERPHLYTEKNSISTVVEKPVTCTKTSLVHRIPAKTHRLLKVKSEPKSKILFGTATLSIGKVNAKCSIDDYRRALLQSILFIEKRSSHFNDDWKTLEKALGLYRLGRSDRYLPTRVPTWKHVRSRVVKILNRRPFRCKTYFGRSLRSLYKSFITGKEDVDKNILSYFYGSRSYDRKPRPTLRGSINDRLRINPSLLEESDRSDSTTRINGWYCQLEGMLSFY
jgi:hypothetical protein